MKRRLNVLVVCECSGAVRDAFRALGHNAWSCDLKPSESPSEFHIVGDALSAIDGSLCPISDDWDLVIAHPPCTYLCSMGIWWNHKRLERIPLTDEAAAFFMMFVDCAPAVVIENPIGTMSSRYRKPDQIINPWQFGHEANKPTCLWLKGVPKLIPTQIVDKGKFYVKANGARMSAWSHITSGTNKEKRATIAARTFPGIAKAMAKQWSEFLLSQ